MELLLPDDEDFDHDRGQSRMNSPTKIDCLGGEKSGVVSEEKTRENDEYNERNGKTLRYESEDGGSGNEAARHDKEPEEDYQSKNRYNGMAYSKPPEQYESMFMLNDKGQALDTKRKRKGELYNMEDEDYDSSSSEEDMEEVLQIMAEKKKAKKRRKGKKMSTTKVVCKGKKGDQRIKRKGTLRSSKLVK